MIQSFFFVTHWAFARVGLATFTQGYYKRKIMNSTVFRANIPSIDRLTARKWGAATQKQKLFNDS